MASFRVTVIVEEVGDFPGNPVKATFSCTKVRFGGNPLFARHETEDALVDAWGVVAKALAGVYPKPPSSRTPQGRTLMADSPRQVRTQHMLAAVLLGSLLFWGLTYLLIVVIT